MNLELLKVIVYHEDIAMSRAHIMPKQIVNFVLFFIIKSSIEIYLSLDEINISLYECIVNSKDTNISLVDMIKLSGKINYWVEACIFYLYKLFEAYELECEI